MDAGRDGFTAPDLLLITTLVDDEWSAGQAGLYRATGTEVAHEFDDVKIWLDRDADGILDAGDDVQVADTFNSGALTLSYDDNGNLTDDGILAYVYDAWNRLVQAQRSAAGDTTTVATYVYDGKSRRVSKTVTNNGVENVDNDGGTQTVHFYYSNQWQILETRDGSNAALRQWAWGTRYVDQPLFMDVNGSPSGDNDCDPDSGVDSGDSRYVYHQDRNWNVVALTGYETPETLDITDGAIIERYAYTPYGSRTTFKGTAPAGVLGSVLHASPAGNPFGHQGLYFDDEKDSYQNRWREYAPRLQRFAQRDPLMMRRPVNARPNRGHLYNHPGSNPVRYRDPRGLDACVSPSEPDTRHPVHPLVDFIVAIYNFFAGHDIHVWSDGSGCTQVDDEKRGGCGLCHQRCKWECTRVRICVQVDLDETQPYCCIVVGSAGDICNSGWVSCLIGDHILFSCEPGVHDLQDFPYPPQIECEGLAGAIEDWLYEHSAEYFP